MQVFKDKSECCGCGACAMACPKDAIKMVTDENGFKFPLIDDDKCISCGICVKTCSFQKGSMPNNLCDVYAISRKNIDELKLSASGGVFAGFAENLINDENAVVFGSAMQQKNDILTPVHISAESVEDLMPILGSKYVQSDLRNTFFEVKELLKKGRNVLYSGTPCQIAGLKSYLKKDYDNLLTMDLVCHGVPSAAMFEGYLSVLKNKFKAKITDFKFRDKKSGWGLNAKVTYQKKNVEKNEWIASNKSSYYHTFLDSETYRESCYSCPYTNANHPADITIGDFWGIEEEHPDYLAPKGLLEKTAGVSMMMINTEKGKAWFDKVKDDFIYYPSTFEAVSKHNHQLCHPSIPGENRNLILEIYKSGGYRKVEKWYNDKKKKEYIKSKIIRLIPTKVFHILKKIIKR